MVLLRLATAVGCSLALTAAEPQVVPLYPGAPPGSEAWNWSENERVSTDGLCRVANVTRPTLTVYLPEENKTDGTAVVICPGGGFRHLAIHHEGEDVARWFNEQGVAAFVLKYRLMRTGDESEKKEGVMARRRAEVTPQAVADGLEAIRLVRRRAVEWGVNKDRIGILGFSAGGWVATAVALQGRDDSRPDFLVPVYATMPENMIVPAAPPPLFLVHADDDTSVEATRTTIRLYRAWKQAGGSAELHIYSKGGHGFGMRRQSSPVDTWTLRLRDWMAARGLIGLAGRSFSQ
jgi:acetyl esterase/lipase